MTFNRDHSQGRLEVEGMFTSRRFAGPDLGALENNVLIAKWSQPPAIPPHSHDHEEVLVCLSGSGVALAGGEEIPFAAGDVWISPAGELHTFTDVGPDGLEYFGGVADRDEVVCRGRHRDGAIFPLLTPNGCDCEARRPSRPGAKLSVSPGGRVPE